MLTWVEPLPASRSGPSSPSSCCIDGLRLTTGACEHDTSVAAVHVSVEAGKSSHLNADGLLYDAAAVTHGSNQRLHWQLLKCAIMPMASRSPIPERLRLLDGTARYDQAAVFPRARMCRRRCLQREARSAGGLSKAVRLRRSLDVYTI